MLFRHSYQSSADLPPYQFNISLQLLQIPESPGRKIKKTLRNANYTSANQLYTEGVMPLTNIDQWI